MRTLVVALLFLSPDCYAQMTSATSVKPASAEKSAEQKKRDDLYTRAGFYIWRYRGNQTRGQQMNNLRTGKKNATRFEVGTRCPRC
jgi:hypothetical protein